MPTPSSVLAVHEQKFNDSCAAAAMELLLKLHGKVDPDWFDFQNRFQNQNIGFEQLAVLSPYGITATQDRLPKDQCSAFLTAETHAGRFPLVSLPNVGQQLLVTGQSVIGGWHIWTAIPHGQSFQLVSGGLGRPVPDVLPNFDQMIDRILHFEPSYVIHHVRYTVSS